eukprot:5900692-Amphidinium_carterae.1
MIASFAAHNSSKRFFPWSGVIYPNASMPQITNICTRSSWNTKQHATQHGITASRMHATQTQNHPEILMHGGSIGHHNHASNESAFAHKSSERTFSARQMTKERRLAHHDAT